MSGVTDFGQIVVYDAFETTMDNFIRPGDLAAMPGLSEAY